LCGSTPITTAAIETLLPFRRAKTVAGTPNSRTYVALTPFLSHATARPRQAGTSFGSQPRQGGRRDKSQPTGTSQRYDPAHFHPGQVRTVYPKSQLGGSARGYQPG
jgi:hypothetical protein